MTQEFVIRKTTYAYDSKTRHTCSSHFSFPLLPLLLVADLVCRQAGRVESFFGIPSSGSNVRDTNAIL